MLIFLEDLLRSEEHTSELQSLRHLVCRLLLEKKKQGRPPRQDPNRPPRRRPTSRATVRRAGQSCANTGTYGGGGAAWFAVVAFFFFKGSAPPRVEPLSQHGPLPN